MPIRFVPWKKSLNHNVIVHNKLSRKPQKAIQSVERIMEEYPEYKVLIKQDYVKNNIDMELLKTNWRYSNRSSIHAFDIIQSGQVPITRNAKAYRKALRNMLENRYRPIQETVEAEQTILPIAPKQKKNPSIWNSILNFFRNIICF